MAVKLELVCLCKFVLVFSLNLTCLTLVSFHPAIVLNARCPVNPRVLDLV
jgi:hypothetical protein